MEVMSAAWPLTGKVSHGNVNLQASARARIAVALPNYQMDGRGSMVREPTGQSSVSRLGLVRELCLIVLVARLRRQSIHR